jgi:hypothetical protein
MILSFELSMPGRASWNGKWSGEHQCWAIVKSYRGKEVEEKMKNILEAQPYSYRWEDGWAASVAVRKVNAKEAQRIRKKSAGFAGYDWEDDNLTAEAKEE